MGRPSHSCRGSPLGWGATVRHWGPRLGVGSGSGSNVLDHSGGPPLGSLSNQSDSPLNASVTLNLRVCRQGGPGSSQDPWLGAGADPLLATVPLKSWEARESLGWGPLCESWRDCGLQEWGQQSGAPVNHLEPRQPAS